jgi:hypothetical protein
MGPLLPSAAADPWMATAANTAAKVAAAMFSRTDRCVGFMIELMASSPVSRL